MANENREFQDRVENFGIWIALGGYTDILRAIGDFLAALNTTEEIDKKVAEINLSNGESDNFELNKMSCLMLMTLTGGEVNKEGTKEIMIMQLNHYLKYIQEVARYVENPSKDNNNLTKRKKETIEKMQELYNQVEVIGLEVEGSILTKKIFTPYQAAIKNIHELATAMLLLDEKKEDEFVKEYLPQEVFLNTIEGIVLSAMSGEKEAQERAMEKFENLKKYTAQALESTDTRQQLTENSNKIKTLVSPESKSE